MTSKEYLERAKRTRGTAYTVEELRRMEESHEVRDCPDCYEGLVYDTGVGAWVDHDGCSGSGRARVFVYAKATSSTGWLRECAGCRERFAERDLYELGPEQAEWSLTVGEGERYCRPCARRHGVL